MSEQVEKVLRAVRRCSDGQRGGRVAAPIAMSAQPPAIFALELLPRCAADQPYPESSSDAPAPLRSSNPDAIMLEKMATEADIFIRKGT